MGNAAPILARQNADDDLVSDMTDISDRTVRSDWSSARTDRVAVFHALWFKLADTAIRVGDLVMLQKALVRRSSTMDAQTEKEELEMLCTTAAAVGRVACLCTLVEFAADRGLLLHLRAADAAASLHGRTECAIYIRDLLWPSSAAAQHQKRLCALLGVEFGDLESGAYHLARSTATCPKR
jgi:hypothetical protein